MLVVIACDHDCCLQKPFELKRQVKLLCPAQTFNDLHPCLLSPFIFIFPPANVYWLAPNPLFLYMIIRYPIPHAPCLTLALTQTPPLNQRHKIGCRIIGTDTLFFLNFHGDRFLKYARGVESFLYHKGLANPLHPFLSTITFQFLKKHY